MYYIANEGWLFFDQQDFWTTDRVEAYLNGVEDDTEMIVLDLFSEAEPQWERTQSYYGKKWVWCLLHGASFYPALMRLWRKHGLGREFTRLDDQSAICAAEYTQYGWYGSRNGGTRRKRGIALNYADKIVYALLLDQAWSNTSIDSAKYVVDWVERRYGPKNTSPQILQAWDMLRLTVYNNTYKEGVSSVVKSIFVSLFATLTQEIQPNITGLTGRTGHHGTAMFYNPTELTIAWEMLVNTTLANPSLLDIPTFHNDMVDITRQVFANAFIVVYDDLISSWNAKDISNFQSQALKLIDLLTDLDKVLSTDASFILGKWIADARQWASENDTYADYLEYNARNQVSPIIN